MYRNKIYSKYISIGYGTINSTGYARSLQSFELNYRKILLKNKDISILEIGCGMGHFQEFLRKSGFINRTAIDIGPEQIEHCRNNVEGKFILVEDSNQYLKECFQLYDMIIMNDVVEHFTKNETIAILENIHYALRPGGRLIMRTPNMAAIFASASRYGDFTHETGFTERSARQVLAASGFDEICCYPERNYVRSPLKRLVFSILNAFRLSVLKTLVYLERPGDRYPTIFSKNLIIVAALKSAK